MLMHVAQGKPGETATRYKHFPSSVRAVSSSSAII